ncbi:MAG: molybdopterin-binding protein [Pseudomonadota bacterium]
MSDPTAAVLLIGDELLSGRTRDLNLQQIAEFLSPIGIPVKETRIVCDERDDIIAAVNALRARYTYVFTTGGIGPTHDDITADAIAAAFGVGISEHSELLRAMAKRYEEMGAEFTPARRRMTRIPHGSELIANSVSGAPGFQTENVFTLAGVPSIVRAMLDDVAHRLQGGAKLLSVTFRGKGLHEGDIAEPLGRLAKQIPEINFGSYPWFRSLDDAGVQIVARGTVPAQLEKAADAIAALMHGAGVEPERVEGHGTA